MADFTHEQRPQLGIGAQGALAGISLCAGIAPLAARWISNDAIKLAYGLFLCLVYLTVTLVARRTIVLRPFWPLSFAFFIFAFVQLLNNAIPPYVATHLLHAPSVPGNPLASTVSGTVIIEVLDSVLAILPIIVLIVVSGQGLVSIYARVGKTGRWLILPIITLILFSYNVASHHSERYIPTNGHVSGHQLVAWIPLVLIMVSANVLQEEFLFRGLFLQRYDAFFGPPVSNVLQAIVFAVAHAGVTYTTGLVLFIVLFIFPIGLVCGYLMRRTNGVVIPALFHAGFDIPIFVAFLSYCLK
jgi:membrane protease YdiL (CAAX protease family)